MRQLYFVFVFTLCTVWGCVQSPSLPVVELETEARSFMEAYAQDLLDHDVAAIAARYDSSGAYFLGGGQKRFERYDSIRTRYAERWQGPSTFEWHDLSYEVLSPDAVLIVGLFSWGQGDSVEALNVSYSGLLKRQDGELRIRLEDESVDPRALKEFICADNTGG